MSIPAWAIVGVLAVVLVGLLWFATRSSGDDDEDAADDETASTVDEGGRPGDTIPPAAPTTTGPDGQPPQTSIAPSSIGTVDDPVPVGQAFVNGLYELRVDGATYDADEVLAESNPAHADAPAGQQRVLVELTVSYLEDFGFINTSGLFLSASDGSRTWLDFEADCGPVPDSVLDGLVVEAGESVTGNACFTVPVDVDPLYLTADGFDGPLYFALPPP